MNTKNKTDEETLKVILDKIQEIKRINIGKISQLSGYSNENYLSERLSSRRVSDNVINRVKSLLEKAKVSKHFGEKTNRLTLRTS